MYCRTDPLHITLADNGEADIAAADQLVMRFIDDAAAENINSVAAHRATLQPLLLRLLADLNYAPRVVGWKTCSIACVCYLPRYFDECQVFGVVWTEEHQ